jgi:hypothetical protein
LLRAVIVIVHADTDDLHSMRQVHSVRQSQEQAFVFRKSVRHTFSGS